MKNMSDKGFSHGDKIPIDSRYQEGDLVKFCYMIEEQTGSLTKNKIMRHSYSRIVKVIPKFLKDSNTIHLHYLMENKKFISYVDIRELLLRGDYDEQNTKR